MIYDEIKQIARDKNMSVRELCRRADVNYRTVAKWKQSEPTAFEVLRKIKSVENN